jgi:uncharacterized protein
MEAFDLEAITRIARKQKLGLGNAEKDYVLSAALEVISGLPLDLVFKGGTCIKKAYYPEFRFSSDLDFAVTGKDDYAGKIRNAFENKEIHGIPFLKVKTIEREKEGNATLAVQYSSKASATGHVDSIRTEFSAETPVLFEARKLEVISPPEYRLQEAALKCMALEEILAEKIHAIYHRRKPRDLYDLSYLLDKEITVDHGMIAEKLRPLNVSIEAGTFRERTELLGERWNDDLGKLFIEVPDFRKAQEKAMKSLFG